MNESPEILSARQLISKLRQKKPARRKLQYEGLTLGERISDSLTRLVGSWTFIIVQAILLAIWIVINVIAWQKAWDPYPFILLNLVLSFQAAFTAPFIMMSQNRQNIIDRLKAENDYDINVKAEMEIELLHEKVDEMRNNEIAKIIQLLENAAKKS